MAPSLRNITVLLLQARDEPKIIRGEQTCFVERCGIEEEQLRTVSVHREGISRAALDDADALMIGGASTYNAHGDYPWMEALLDVCRAAAERGLPTFGSCWGHQILARAFGGTVAHDKGASELGGQRIYLTEAGRRDELTSTLPPEFTANTGHHDRVTALPPEAVEMAFSDSQRHQAFRMKGRPVYGTQFHSELSGDRERERLIAYRDYYRDEIGSEEAFTHILASLTNQSPADDLLRTFLERFVLLC